MTQLLVNEGLAFVANNNLGRRATGQQLFDSGCTRDLNRVRPHRENARMTPVSQKKDLKFGMPWCRRGHGACPRPRSSTMAVPPHRPDQQHENSHELSYCQLLLLSSLVTLSICRTRSNAPTLNTTYLDGSYVFIADVPSLIKFASTTPHSATAHAFALGFRFCPRLC